MFKAGLIGLFLMATDAEANSPSVSLRPVTRADTLAEDLSKLAPRSSMRPRIRSTRAERRAAKAARKNPQTHFTSDGTQLVSICRDPDLFGLPVGRVPGKLPGCGVQNAVKLYVVSGVKLSSPVVMECDTASAIKSWVENGMAPAVGKTGGGVAKLQVAAGYACRTRNSRPGAKISEHGKGRAIDIAGFHLQNGDKISVLSHWNNGSYGRILRNMHRSACGPFGTVLGPESDRFHQDHFHFDIAKHRGGPYCR